MSLLDTIPDRGAEHRHLGLTLGRRALAHAAAHLVDVDLVIQRDQRRVVRPVREKRRAEVLVRDTGPVERPALGGAPDNLLEGFMLFLAVGHGVDRRLRVGLRRLHVAESSRPGQRRVHGRAVPQHLNIGMDHVIGAEAEGLHHLQIAGLVTEAEASGRLQHARCRGHIQSIAQRTGHGRVVGIQRQRVAEELRSARMHQIQRMAGVIRVALQNPRGHIPALVGKRDAIELIFDNRRRDAGRLHRRCVAGLCGAGARRCRVVHAGNRVRGGSDARRSARRLRLRIVSPAPVLEPEQHTQHHNHHQHERAAILAAAGCGAARIRISKLWQKGLPIFSLRAKRG